MTVNLRDHGKESWMDLGGKVDMVETSVTVWKSHLSRYALSDH